MAKISKLRGDKTIVAMFKYKPDEGGGRSIPQNIIVEVKSGLITLSLPNSAGLINISPSVENNKLCLVASPVGGEGSHAAYCEVLTRAKNPPG